MYPLIVIVTSRAVWDLCAVGSHAALGAGALASSTCLACARSSASRSVERSQAGMFSSHQRWLSQSAMSLDDLLSISCSSWEARQYVAGAAVAKACRWQTSALSDLP